MPQRVLSIDTDEDDVAVSVFELIVTVLKCEDFCLAEETEGGGYEHNDKSRCFEIRGGRVLAGLDVDVERHTWGELLFSEAQ
jgi:hypothetical protein